MERKEKSVKLPEKLKKQMELWRQGITTLPKGYIQFHKELAEKDLEELKAEGVIVHNTYMASDGWADGMQVLYAIIEEGERLDKIKWDDGSQCFFVKLPSGISSPLLLHRKIKDDLYIQVTNDKGIPFNVRLLRKGDRYGLNRSLIKNDGVEVEFYDARYIEGFDQLGQFVSRYNLSTIISDYDYLTGKVGLDLYGGVPSWYINASKMAEVITWLKEVAN